jgi:hypothetical protein
MPKFGSADPENTQGIPPEGRCAVAACPLRVAPGVLRESRLSQYEGSPSAAHVVKTADPENTQGFGSWMPPSEYK